VDVIVLGVLGLFVWQGAGLCLTTWGLEFPAMEISRGYLYLSLPVGATLMIVAIAKRWCEGNRGAGGGGRAGRPAMMVVVLVGVLLLLLALEFPWPSP